MPGTLVAGASRPTKPCPEGRPPFGGTRTTINLDIYNALNADTIRTVNNTFLSVWQTPTAVLLARFMKISATWDF